MVSAALAEMVGRCIVEASARGWGGGEEGESTTNRKTGQADGGGGGLDGRDDARTGGVKGNGGDHELDKNGCPTEDERVQTSAGEKEVQAGAGRKGPRWAASLAKHTTEGRALTQLPTKRGRWVAAGQAAPEPVRRRWGARQTAAAGSAVSLPNPPPPAAATAVATSAAAAATAAAATAAAAGFRPRHAATQTHLRQGREGGGE